MSDLPAAPTGTDFAVTTGATVVITHRVRDGHQHDYDQWLSKITPIARSFPGFVDWQIVRPLVGVTFTYTVIIRFDTETHLRSWLSSDERRGLIEQVRPHLATDDDFFVRSGLDFWFTPEGAKARIPVRWKQFLITWSAIYPLVLLMPLIVAPLLHRVGMPDSRWIHTFFVSGSVVLLMVYVVMPRYTRLVHRWLFSGGSQN